MKIKVVPEPSARCTTVIGLSGNSTPALTLRIAGSFHRLTVPRKMSASTALGSLSSPAFTPGTFTTATTPPMICGHWISPYRSRSAGFMGASEAPKSTVRALICLIPPPEPID
ncbi:hypothetical protein BMS3Abin12_00615 [bacterium BMS3Abin12]|nr:hypothetical protein BMS3Abin12_00615 [bacterium BMS3Abin12]